MYKIRRERYRRGKYPSDVGPEGGIWRYDVDIGPYESKLDCVEAIVRMEGEIARDRIEHDHNGPWRYQGNMKPTGYMEYDKDADEIGYKEYCKTLMRHWSYAAGYSRLPTLEEYLQYCIWPRWAGRYWDEYYIMEFES